MDPGKDAATSHGLMDPGKDAATSDSWTQGKMQPPVMDSWTQGKMQPPVPERLPVTIHNVKMLIVMRGEGSLNISPGQTNDSVCHHLLVLSPGACFYHAHAWLSTPVPPRHAAGLAVAAL